jgi:arsenate reductase
MKKRILVIGTDNSCRSAMMAALIKHITFNKVEVINAGIEPQTINPLTLKILEEIGVDASGFEPVNFTQYIHDRFDIIITTSDKARELTVHFMGNITKIHKEFDDPRLVEGDTFEKENAFRELREDMYEWLNDFIVRHRLV